MDQTMTHSAPAITPKKGWSWGALMLNVSFLIAVKRYNYLWWWVLSLIPIVNIIFWIVMAIYLGIKGHELGANGKQFASQAEYDGYMKATDHAGKVTFIVFVVVLVCAAILIFSGIGIAYFGMHSPLPQGAPMIPATGAMPQ